MENLFSAAYTAAKWFRFRAGKRGLVLDDAEWDEVIDSVVLFSVGRFLSKLRNGNYNRKHSFYLNVWSCVWSVFYSRVDQYLRHVLQKKINSLDKMDPAVAQHFKDTRPMPRPASKSESVYAHENLMVWLTRSTHSTFLKHEDEDDFYSYLEACEELGMEPDKKAPLYKRGVDILGTK